MIVALGVIIPFVGTSLGALLVFFIRGKMNEKIEKILLGFAGGVMVAASIWSLIDPALELSSEMGKWAFVPSAVGFLIGVGFILLLDSMIPHIHQGREDSEGVKSNFRKTTKMMLAVTIHNIPEGMSVGVVLAGAVYGNSLISLSSALVLAIGIAVQNFLEGSVISIPLYAEGMSKPKAFLLGVLSGVVEPIAALLTIVCVQFITPILPYILAFAAGAMVYVVVEELIPESQMHSHTNLPTIAFSIGFVLMMILDVALS